MISDIGSNMMMPVSPTMPQASSISAVETSFSDLLSSERGREKIKIVKEESKKLVAEAFIAPILAKIRATNNAAPPFGPSTAEERFGPMLDRVVADAMTRPDRFPMVKVIERSIMARMDTGAGGGA